METVITHISMRLMENDDKIKAYASIVINDSIKINGIKIVMTKTGKLLVVLPEAENRKLQYVVPVTQEMRQHIDEKLIAHYFKLKKNISKNANQNTANLKGNDTDVN